MKKKISKTLQATDIERARFRKNVQGKQVELGSSDAIRSFGTQVQVILNAIATVTDEPGMAEAFVSDLSSIGDFICCLDGEDETEATAQLERLSSILGIEVLGDELLIDIAKKLADKPKS